MNYYFDIQLFPDPEFPPAILMNALFTKLHKALFDMQSVDIGVSFPDYGKTLGQRLRLHGSETNLNKLQERKWTGSMAGFCRQTPVSPIPSSVKYRRVFRKQRNTSNAKLQRLLKRGSLSEHEAPQYLNRMKTHKLSEPFLELVSVSTGQKHRRYIQLGELKDEPANGVFDYFGLSKHATVPWFNEKE